MVKLFIEMSLNENIKGIESRTLRKLKDHRSLINYNFRKKRKNDDLFLELLSSNSIEDKQLKISTYDNKNNDVVQNVTYFLSISKDNENLVREYFFAEGGILLIDIHPNDKSPIKIIFKPAATPPESAVSISTVISALSVNAVVPITTGVAALTVSVSVVATGPKPSSSGIPLVAVVAANIE